MPIHLDVVFNLPPEVGAHGVIPLNLASAPILSVNRWLLGINELLGVAHQKVDSHTDFLHLRIKTNMLVL